MFVNNYEVLIVDPDATEDEIYGAYLDKGRFVHAYLDQPLKTEADMKNVNAAYETLSNFVRQMS